MEPLFDTAQDNRAWGPDGHADSRRTAIREELERIAASPMFRSSKRYPALLRFVVERALDGRVDDLKERTIGIEVFQRHPDYDTNQDPVVRTTALEVRRRLGEYYADLGSGAPLRIVIPHGSYVPEFHVQLGQASAAASAPPEIQPAPLRQRWVLWGGVGIVLVLTFAAFWLWPRSSATALDDFWAPLSKSAAPVLLVIGEPSPAPPLDLAAERVPFSDAMAVARTAALLGAKRKTFQVRLNSDADLQDLRNGPVVLLGPESKWSASLTGQARFRIEHDSQNAWISDRQRPDRTSWRVSLTTPAAEMSERYALVTRVFDRELQQFVVIASGLTSEATGAAGEFVTEPQFLAEIAKSAPKDWSQKNMQFVIVSKRVGLHLGAPRVADSFFW